jgi:hypothetical protein
MSDSLLIPTHDLKRANVLGTFQPEDVLHDKNDWKHPAELGVWDACMKGSPKAHLIFQAIEIIAGELDENGEEIYALAYVPLGIEQTRALRDTLTAWLDEQVSK